MHSCLDEDRGASMSFDATSIQMYFSQFSRSSHTNQGIYKRSRPISSSFYGFADTEEQDTSLLRAHSSLDGTLLSNYFSTDVKDVEAHSAPGDLLKSSGLVRSQSYPLEGFHSAMGSCFVKVSTTPWSAIKGGFCTSGSELPCVEKEVLFASWINNADTGFSECRSPVIVGGQQHAVDQNIMSISDSLLNAKLPTNAEAELPPSFAQVDVDSLRNAAPQVESNGSYDMAMGVLQGEGSSGKVEAQRNPHHCMTARPCPFGSKVLACGRRSEMEDTAAVVPSFTALPCGMLGMCCCSNDSSLNTSSELHFFGIYDGHGGSQASTYCKERLHSLLAEELKRLDVGENCHEDCDEGWMPKWKKTMTECFSKIDREVGGVCPNGLCDADGDDHSCECCDDAIAPENVGTTAVVAVVGSCQIVVGNCGDSRAVLSRGGKAMALSRDHKPEREDETSRIEAAGGRVICWDGYRVGGFLALSRAIGDRYLKRYVISEPEVMCVQREEDDEFLILASDGLWDVLSNDYACDLARKGLLAARKKRENRIFSPGEDPAATSVAALLVKLAYNKGSKDNISVVVIDLKG